jgi:hypothetical protein
VSLVNARLHSVRQIKAEDTTDFANCIRTQIDDGFAANINSKNILQHSTMRSMKSEVFEGNDLKGHVVSVSMEKQI